MFSFRNPQQNRSFQQLCKIYPRSSPYIESNLHKFGTGPSSTILPVQNEMPVFKKNLSLNSNQYFRKTDDKIVLCHCCLEPINSNNDSPHDPLAMQLQSNANQQNSSNMNEADNESNLAIVNQQSQRISESQTSLMKYFGKNKQQKAIQPLKIIKQIPLCCDCQQLICQFCARKCNKCHKTVCKFDYKEDNSLGIHSCI